MLAENQVRRLEVGKVRAGPDPEIHPSWLRLAGLAQGTPPTPGCRGFAEEGPASSLVQIPACVGLRDNEGESQSSLVAWWVKDLVLSLLWLKSLQW